MKTTAQAQAFIWPLEGARMPHSILNIPGANRSYRSGKSQGFTFTGGDSGVKVRYGAPVRAANDGQVIRSDLSYNEPSETAYRKLLRVRPENADGYIALASVLLPSLSASLANNDTLGFKRDFERSLGMCSFITIGVFG